MQQNKFLVGISLLIGIALIVLRPHGISYSLIALIMANAVTLWIVKKSIIDDHRLTLDEGFSIILIQVLGIMLFEELSFLF